MKKPELSECCGAYDSDSGCCPFIDKEEENGYKLSNPRPNGAYAVEFNIEGLGINQHPGNEVVFYFSQRPVMDNHYPNQRRVFSRMLQTMGGNSGWLELRNT